MWKHERGSGTRQGQGIPYSVRSFHPTAKATGNKRCPVKIYKEFIEKMQGCSAVSNHPGRKTYISRLLDAKVAENFGRRRKYRFLRIRLV